MPLTQDEIDGCRDAFLAFDKDRSGTIDVWELRQVLEAMGQKPTEEELFQMISEVDDNMSGSIDFGEFLKVRCIVYMCVCVCVCSGSFLFFFVVFFFLYIIITVGSFVVVVCAQVIETQKERAAQFDDESDLIDAYVACGGNADKSGCVSADMLIKIIKHDFGLTIDIEELIRAIDTDGSGEVSLQKEPVPNAE